ncbi:LADA_0H09538g1_1 [Lachancea dasiensis]|uniref:Serine/threonine-protein kinase Tel1 n=1 Tax=Lachancea dasiensis TaxID=1072105 RepID=A0A1G4K2V0_9SACH|nr:LADA_0H09538g1_1 [Lachancea dasiensis]
MDSSLVPSIVDLLSSGKLKERNHGLDELTTLLKQDPGKLPPKYLYSILEILVEIVELERVKYEKLVADESETTASRRTAVENRLSSASYVLRLVVLTTNSKFKSKHVKFLVTLLPELMAVSQSPKLLTGVSVHLLCALESLVNSECFQLKFEPHQWATLVRKSCAYLASQLDFSLNNNDIHYLLNILNTLLHLDSANLPEVESDFMEPLIKILQRSHMENGCTKSLLRLVNSYVLFNHLVNYVNCLEVLESTMRYVVRIGKMNTDGIDRELAIFNVYLSSLANFRRLAPTQKNEIPVHPEPERFIQIFEDYINTTLSNIDPLALKVSSYQFANVSDRMEWLEYEAFQLDRSSEIVPSLTLFAICEILATYYQISDAKSVEEEGLLFKRSRKNLSFESILWETLNPASFISKCLESSDKNFQLIALQVCGFYAASHDFEGFQIDQLVTLIIQRFKDPRMEGWVCFALTPLLSSSKSEIPPQLTQKIFHLTLPLVKSIETCRSACALIKCLLEFHSSDLVTDSLIVQQVNNLYELSDVNGPALLNNEAFLFWMHLYIFEPFRPATHISAYTKTTSWLISKWKYVDFSKSEQSQFHVFIAWLAGVNSADLERGAIDHFSPQFGLYYLNWERYSQEREFLLGRPSYLPQRAQNSLVVPKASIDTTQLRNVMKMFVTYISEATDSDMTRIKWCCKAVKLMFQLVGHPTLTEQIRELECEIIKAARRITDPLVFLSQDILNELYTLKTVTVRSHIFFSNLTIPSLLSVLGSILLEQAKLPNSTDAMDNFENSRERKSQSSTPAMPERIIATIDGPVIDCVLRLMCLKGSTLVGETREDKLNNLVVFLGNIPDNCIFASVPAVIRFMKSAGPFESELSSMGRLTQILGSALLSPKYNTSDVSISRLAAFLDSTRWAWLPGTFQQLHSDSIDILDWLTTKLNENSFSGILALTDMSTLLLNMLRFHDLSSGSFVGGKQKIFGSLINCLRRLPLHAVISAVQGFQNYLAKISLKNQIIVFSEFAEIFQPLEDAIEIPAFHSMLLSKSEMAAGHQVVLAALDLLQRHSRAISQPYVDQCLDILAKSSGLESRQELFHLFRFEIIDHWYNLSLTTPSPNFERWEISAFGFESRNIFVKRYSIELSSFCFANNHQLSFLIESLRAATEKNDRSLLEDCLHLTIPLGHLLAKDFDFIHKQHKQALGKRYASLNKDLAREIAYWVLHFTKWDSIDVLRRIFNGLGSKPTLSTTLLACSTTSLRVHSNLQLDSELSVTILKAHVHAHHLDALDLSFLLFRIASEMKSTTVPSLRVNKLRQIKCLILLFEKSLEACSALPKVVRYLTHILRGEELFGEFVDLLHFIILLNFNHITEVIEMYLAIFTFFLGKHGMPIARVTAALETNLSSQDDVLAVMYSSTWKACLGVLKGDSLDSRVYLNDELLKVDQPSEDRYLLLSNLFEFHSKPEPFPLNFTYSQQVTLNLIDPPCRLGEVETNFNQWRGYYVGGFYLKNACIPKALKCHPLTSSPDCQKSHLQRLINSLISSYSQSEEPDSYLALSSALALSSEALAKYSFDKTSPDVGLSSTIPIYMHLTTREFRLLPLNEPLFKGTTAHHEAGIGHISHDKWIAVLICEVSQELELILPGFCCFAVLASQDTSIAESMLLDLLLILENLNQRNGSAFFQKLLKIGPSLIRVTDMVDFKMKASFLLRVFSTVQRESGQGNRSFSVIYNELDLRAFYKLASSAGKPVLAYMIFEECSDGLDGSDLPTLQNVFEAVGDFDLMQSLPVNPSIDYALSSVAKFDARSFKNFIFNNCKFNVDSILDRGPQLGDLIRTSNLNGFSGLAEILGSADAMHSKRTNNEAFQWSLRLGKWDLPAPEEFNSASGALYSLLKNVQGKPAEIMNLSRSHLSSVVHKASLFLKQDEWAASLTTILCIELFNSHCDQPQYLRSLMEQTQNFDLKRMENAAFTDHQIYMKARQMFLSLLSDASVVQACECVELANYASIARQSNDVHESLTAAMLLDRKAGVLGTMTEDTYWNQLATLEGAQALWLQGEHQIAISMLRKLLHEKKEPSFVTTASEIGGVQISSVQLRALLVEWSSFLRKENAQSIYAKYISETTSNISTVESYDDRAEIFIKFGEFCFQQLRRLEDDDTVHERRKRSKRGNTELSSLLELVRDANISDQDRKDAKKHYNRLKLQIEQDEDFLASRTKQEQLFTWKSIHFYLSALVYGTQLDENILDKFCGIWFQYAEDGELNSKLYHEISSIPSFKFIPWVNQLTSRLNMDNTPFQRNLQLTLKRVMFKLPNETLYPLVSLKLYKQSQAIEDPFIELKVKAVEKLFKELEKYDNGKFSRFYLDPIEEFCERSVELSSLKIAKSSRSIDLANLKSGNYWLESIKRRNLSLPTDPIPITCSADGRKPRATITGLEPVVSISTSGLSLPKIATFYLSDGSKHKVLMKGSNDDLRQDSIMEQVFKQVNQILKKNPQTRKRSLRIRTYEVVPLGPQAGLIEFVPKSVSLHAVLNFLHDKDELTFDKARKMMKQVQSKPVEEKIAMYLKITDSIKPRLRHFFLDSFCDSRDWLEAKYAYTKGVVTTSIVGYILGLGDRHLNNILLDVSNGEPVHIDLGVAFDQGRLLPIPELVPFRLTREIVDGLGVTGVEGVFRRNCERVFSVLHSERERVMNVLNVLKWDPLYSWVVSPLRKRKLQVNISDDSEYRDINAHKGSPARDNDESMRALKDVQSKLEGRGLSVEATVEELIQQATDVSNLASIYMGWSPFY